MVIFRKALAQDFEKVYPLLLEFDNPRVTKDDLRQLFVKQWERQEDYFGYLLMADDRVVGFLGLIFCDRTINNNTHKFCNLTTGIVKKEYRNQSLLLFLHLLKLKGYTITDFTPSKEVGPILKKLGFKDLEVNMKIILPIPVFLNDKCSVEFDKNEIRKSLDKRDLQIYDDHSKLKAIHLLIKSREGNGYIICSRVKKKNLYFARIHYFNNSMVFQKYINKVSVKICWRLNVSGLLIDERQLDKTIRYAVTVKYRQPTLFKSDSLAREDIDTLYSELPVLNL